MSDEPFASLLRRYLTAAGMSQLRLARAAGYDHSYISRLLSGERMPSRDAVEAFADVLGLPPQDRDWLLASAGYGSPRTLAVLHEPVLEQLYAVLRDPQVPAARRVALRSALGALVAAMVADVAIEERSVA